MFDYNKKPILIFWEATKACMLKCRHCRAEAILNPLPGELSTEEAKRLMDMIIGFGKPYPVLIITGGDPLMRKDLFEVIEYARKLDIPTGIAPAVTELLNDETMDRLIEYGVKYVSISLDGGKPDTHDGIRGIEGHFHITIDTLEKLVKKKFKVQVNTLACRETVDDLPYVVKILKDLGINIWEVFFLIRVGRGIEIEDLTPDEYEDVNHFLYEVSRYGFEVRTVEAPFYRRIARWRLNDNYDRNRLDIEYVKRKYGLGELYERLVNKLIELLGYQKNPPKPHIPSTRDGKGIIFISYNGDIHPSGFAPYRLGNIKKNDLVDVYRNNPILIKIRKGEFAGRCGRCEFRDLCGGSRARAYAEYRDILGEDPACIYNPP